MSTIDDDEQLVDLLADELVGEVHAMREMIGERPFMAKKKPERQQARESSQIWYEGPQVWQAMVQQKGPKATAELVKRYMRLRDKYPDEASYVPPPAAGANGMTNG